LHQIEPFDRWLGLYDSSEDQRSPFHGKSYNYDLYSETIYGYYIDPAWDYIGSETLYIKLLYTDYDLRFAIIEAIGEWNDALHNDIMHLKRNIIDHMSIHQIDKFIIIGESVFNFHGSDDSYYEEWFEDVESGWIAFVNFRDFVQEEMRLYNLDMYMNMGGSLQIENWRTQLPLQFFNNIETLIQRRLS